MKRLLAGGLPLILVLACTAGAQERAFDVHPFYPLKPGNQWTYRSGKEKVVIQVEKEVPLEIVRDEKTGKVEKVTGFQMLIRSGPREVIEQVGVLRDGVYRFSTAGKTFKPPLRILKLPLQPDKGEEWKVEGKTEDGKIVRGTFVSGVETVRLTLDGKTSDVAAITVTCKNFQIDDETMAIKNWFAKDLGLVKQQIRTGKHELTLELEQFRPAP